MALVITKYRVITLFAYQDSQSHRNMVACGFMINKNEDIMQVLDVCNIRLMIMCCSVRYTTFIMTCLTLRLPD